MGHTILYIEDNPQNLRLVAKLLSKHGDYNVLKARDGQTGLQMVVDHAPDLILMDINLPGMDGIEVTKRIKSDERLNHIPIIALTANSMYGDRERLLAEGCDDYIAKPIVRRKLLELLSLYLES